MTCWLDDNTGEFLAGRLLRGNAGANSASDHIEAVDAALAQLPDAYRCGTGMSRPATRAH